MTTDTIPVHPHAVDGSERLTEDQARTYLTAEGYGTEAQALMAGAARFPGTYQYTADRHRYLVYVMPGGYWRAGDCTQSEERIKRIGRDRTWRR